MAIKEKYRFNALEPSEFIMDAAEQKPIKSIQFPDQDVLPFSTLIVVNGTGLVIANWIFDGARWNQFPMAYLTWDGVWSI